MKKLFLSIVIATLIAGPVSSSVISGFQTSGTLQVSANHSYDHAVATNEEAAAKANATQPNTETKGCIKVAGIVPYGINWEACFSEIMNMFMSIAGVFLWAAGLVLDTSIDGVVNMQDFLKKIPVVDIGWKIFRDVANISFIFLLLWISISTILGIESGDTKRMLAKLVIVALLINFSLFITRAIVDTANVITIHFYDLMTEGTNSISSSFMEGLKLQTIYDTSSIGKIDANDMSTTGLNEDTKRALAQVGAAENGAGSFNYWNIMLVTAGGTITILVAAFVFFATSLMFLGRTIALMFLMILSPLAFVGSILPGLSGQSKKWWGYVLSQSFFAPLYMILAYIVYLTINSDAYMAWMKNVSFAQAYSSGNGWQIVINFIMIIGLLMGCLVISTSMAGKTSDFGMMLARKARGMAGRTVGHPIKWAGGYAGRSFIRQGALAPLRSMSKGVGTVGGWVNKNWQDNRFKKFGEKEGATSLRAINEKFKDSKFGNTSFGEGLRQKTTGYIAESLKLGGLSAEDAHNRDRQMKAARDAIQKRNDVLATIKRLESQRDKSGKLPEGSNDDIQSVLKDLTVQEFTKHLREDDFLNPLIMQNASSAQLKYFFDNAGKERGLDMSFMKQAAQSANQDIAEVLVPAENKLKQAIEKNNDLLEKVSDRGNQSPPPQAQGNPIPQPPRNPSGTPPQNPQAPPRPNQAPPGPPNPPTPPTPASPTPSPAGQNSPAPAEERNVRSRTVFNSAEQAEREREEEERRRMDRNQRRREGRGNQS